MNRRNFISGASAACLTTVNEKSTMANKTRNVVPPEEAQHTLTFMQWPVSKTVYPEKEFLSYLQKTIANIANTIAEFEPVVMLAENNHHKAIQKLLSAKVELWDIPTQDLWCRDSGPLFTRQPNGKLAISHLKFNGWGKKQVHEIDSKISEKIAQRLNLPLINSGLIGEAGGVEHDGHGLLIAHESSWLNANRNPGLSRNQIERKLLVAYGGNQIIWSPGVWAQDITDYHIDSLARFTGPARILINLPEKPDKYDPFHKAALQTYDKLIASNLKVDVIPEPNRQRVKDIEFVASYANYYACNGAIIAAQFGDKRTDEIARKTLQQLYPEREIVTLNVDALGEIGGGIHCATQQMPAS